MLAGALTGCTTVVLCDPTVWSVAHLLRCLACVLRVPPPHAPPQHAPPQQPYPYDPYAVSVSDPTLPLRASGPPGRRDAGPAEPGSGVTPSSTSSRELLDAEGAAAEPLLDATVTRSLEEWDEHFRSSPPAARSLRASGPPAEALGATLEGLGPPTLVVGHSRFGRPLEVVRSAADLPSPDPDALPHADARRGRWEENPPSLPASMLAADGGSLASTVEGDVAQLSPAEEYEEDFETDDETEEGDDGDDEVDDEGDDGEEAAAEVREEAAASEADEAGGEASAGGGRRGHFGSFAACGTLPSTSELEATLQQLRLENAEHEIVQDEIKVLEGTRRAVAAILPPEGTTVPPVVHIHRQFSDPAEVAKYDKFIDGW